jgi:hypothetical protein
LRRWSGLNKAKLLTNSSGRALDCFGIHYGIRSCKTCACARQLSGLRFFLLNHLLIKSFAFCLFARHGLQTK